MKKITKYGIVTATILTIAVVGTLILQQDEPTSQMEAPKKTVTPTESKGPTPTGIEEDVSTSSPSGATNTPTDAVTNTPTQTSKPTSTTKPKPPATNTPTPEPIKVDSELVYSVQMGDKVWYDFYENGTLVVRGTGSTWDFENANSTDDIIVNEYPEYYYATKILISEGITRIGNNALVAYYIADYISLPSTLEEVGEYAFAWTGYYTSEYGSGFLTWEGMDFERFHAADNSFEGCTGLDHIEGAKNHMGPTPTPTSTPTPTPTITPTPDPDNPRCVHRMQMGDNIYFEFWDNGYLYIKGTGKTYEKSELFDLTEDYQNDNPVNEELCDSIQYMVVEEGVTHIGKNLFIAIGGFEGVKEIWYSKTLIEMNSFINCADDIKIHGYYQGKSVTTKGGQANQFFKYLEDSEYAEWHNATIIWEE